MVEKYARKLFPQGIQIDHSQSFSETIAQSKSALANAPVNNPIYNALITVPSLICEIDILIPVKNGFCYDLYEVKSATSCKDHYLLDIAFQKYVCKMAGLKIRKTHLITINSDYVRQGEIEPKKLFNVQEMDDLIEPFFSKVGENLKAAGSILSSSCPNTPIGCHCSSPYECPLMPLCWKKVLKNDDNIFTLTGLRAEKKWGLYNEGVIRTINIPENYKLNGKQEIQVRADRTGKPNIDPKPIKNFVNQLKYPLYFLDFETFAPAIPMFEGSSPYQQIPFQYSLHVQSAPNQKPKQMAHRSWIWDGSEGGGDPREELLKRLKGLLGKEGSIIVYNATFEKLILKQAVKAFPSKDNNNWLQGILNRFVDLL